MRTARTSCTSRRPGIANVTVDDSHVLFTQCTLSGTADPPPQSAKPFAGSRSNVAGILSNGGVVVIEPAIDITNQFGPAPKTQGTSTFRFERVPFARRRRS
jgi:hypothetical protein